MEETKTKKPRRWLTILLSVLGTAAVLTGAFCLVMGRNGLALTQGYLLAKYAFVGDCNMDDVTDAGLDAMVKALGDRWSYYLDKESYQKTVERRENRYVGIGVTVSYESEKGLLVTEVSTDGPADKAGIVAGDILTAVDGADISGDERYNAPDLISGKEGTAVELSVLSSDGTTKKVTCTRAAVAVKSVTYSLRDDGIGYVRIANFYSGTAEQFKAAVDDLVSKGAKSLLFDVRDDPGGYVEELTDMLDTLLPEGAVFQSRPRWGFARKVESDKNCVDLPFAVLINAQSYSAAELFAGELRESAGAILVGEQTVGKGYSQNTFHLANGGGIGVSTARYYTGSGVSLIGKGLTPDISVALTDSGDAQLSAAVSALLK